MEISRDRIRHVALLARLTLDGDEEAELASSLSAILTYMDKLNELDTSAVEPTAHVVAIAAPWRDDAVVNRPDPETLLATAPARDGNLFRVPKIIE